jgi:hypothetical protein
VLDRPVLTLRTVTIAALVVLLLSPEAVVHPSFRCRLRTVENGNYLSCFNKI